MFRFENGPGIKTVSNVSEFLGDTLDPSTWPCLDWSIYELFPFSRDVGDWTSSADNDLYE
jgi:hypothetical protein